MSSLIRQYIDHYKCTDTAPQVQKAICSYRKRVHSKQQLDLNSKVRLLYALSARIDEDFEKILIKNATVLLDANRRIIKYEANNGTLNLNGNHDQKVILTMEDTIFDESETFEHNEEEEIQILSDNNDTMDGIEHEFDLGTPALERRSISNQMLFQQKNTLESTRKRTSEDCGINTKNREVANKTLKPSISNMDSFENSREKRRTEDEEEHIISENGDRYHAFVGVKQEHPEQIPASQNEKQSVQEDKKPAFINVSSILDQLKTIIEVLDEPVLQDLKRRIDRKAEAVQITNISVSCHYFAETLSSVLNFVMEPELFGTPDEDVVNLKELLLILRTSSNVHKYSELHSFQNDLKYYSGQCENKTVSVERLRNILGYALERSLSLVTS